MLLAAHAMQLAAFGLHLARIRAGEFDALMEDPGASNLVDGVLHLSDPLMRHHAEGCDRCVSCHQTKDSNGADRLMLCAVRWTWQNRHVE
jgi:hypothetical protein